MKAQHRHELKTNELAQWLANLPNWAKENIRIIIYIAVVVVLVFVFYIWKLYQKNIVAKNEQLRFTRLLYELSEDRITTLQQQAQGIDLSYTLLQTANKLQNFASNTKNPDMAALAFIKYAEALRSELHYRMGSLDNRTVSSQIAKAKAGYENAIKNSQNNLTLRALATFGLGLCEEEVRNFDKAKEIYQQIVNDPVFAPTTAAASAQYRLEIMDNYKQMVAFKAPEPLPQPAAEPDILLPDIQTTIVQPPPAAVNVPATVNLPAEL